MKWIITSHDQHKTGRIKHVVYGANFNRVKCYCVHIALCSRLLENKIWSDLKSSPHELFAYIICLDLAE